MLNYEFLFKISLVEGLQNYEQLEGASFSLYLFASVLAIAS